MRILKQNKSQGVWVALGMFSLVVMGWAAWQLVSAYYGQTSFAIPTYVTDLSDDRKLVGLSHNVFFGQVESKSGSSLTKDLAETQFNVTVLETIKGSLSGDITVNQQGGTDGNGHKFRVEGDPDLLQPGKTYLFVTRANTASDKQTNAPGYGNIMLDVRDDASHREILSSEDANQLRTRFTEAYENEVPYQ
jgi:hypothetical protein